MLTLLIRDEQLAVFDQRAETKFVDDLTEHLREPYVDSTGRFDLSSLRDHVRRTVRRARGYGITDRAPLAFFVSLSLEIGAYFDRHPRIRRTLTRSDLTANQRLELLAMIPSSTWELVRQAASTRSADVPYVPTLPEVAQAMLRLADTGPGDTLYDLGCGDGRIVIEAARSFGAKGMGIDIDPEQIAAARRNAEAAGVAERVSFVEGSLFETDISSASVVTLYLNSATNAALAERMFAELPSGARIISHEYDFGAAYPPERSEVVVADDTSHTIHRWTIGERVDTQ